MYRGCSSHQRVFDGGPRERHRQTAETVAGLLFDLHRKPVDQIWQRSLDVRGDRDAVLAGLVELLRKGIRP